MTHPYFVGARYPRVLAHRGLADLDGAADAATWENTAGAFAAADAAGAEFIETDCQVTADGDVVLFHDDTLARLNGDPRSIAEVSTRELHEIFASHGGLLTVSEALEAFPNVRFNIDLKTDAVAERIGPILAPHTDRVLVTSFSDAVRLRGIDAIRRAGAATRPATSGGERTIVALRALTAARLPVSRVLREVDAVQIPERFRAVPVFAPSLVRAARMHGVEVHVWTVNDPIDMQRLIATGADGIVSDRADLAVAAISPT